VIDPNAVPAGKSLRFVMRAAPKGKTRLSPATGATPPDQLAAMDQAFSNGAPPDQVRVAACAGGAARTMRAGSASQSRARHADRKAPEHRRRPKAGGGSCGFAFEPAFWSAGLLPRFCLMSGWQTILSAMVIVINSLVFSCV